jgi:integrase/recombinase XerD
MNPLRMALHDYLSMRRALGFHLFRPGQALWRFVEYAETQRASVITTALALRWARLPEKAAPSTWATRLALVRRFARYCQTIDARTEVPPEGLLPDRLRRKPPHIWSRIEVQTLLTGARRMRSPLGLRGLTYHTFFGLIAGTGLRISEALHLDNSDVDWGSGVLTVRDTKFGKTRLVPVHPTALTALRAYAFKRDQLVVNRDRNAYFVIEGGGRLSQGAVRYVYSRLRKTIPFKCLMGLRRPRIHDLRHSFAVGTLRRWYRSGRDVNALMPRLATYMGHAHVFDTYWYISAVPDLLSSAARLHERKERSRAC